MNIRKHIFAGIMTGAILALACPAMAEETDLRAPATVTSSDGALSIQLPAEEWKGAEDENHLLGCDGVGDEVGGGVGGFHDETQVDLVVVAYGGEDTHVVAVVVVAYGEDTHGVVVVVGCSGNY